MNECKGLVFRYNKDIREYNTKISQSEELTLLKRQSCDLSKCHACRDLMVRIREHVGHGWGNSGDRLNIPEDIPNKSAVRISLGSDEDFIIYRVEEANKTPKRRRLSYTIGVTRKTPAYKRYLKRIEEHDAKFKKMKASGDKIDYESVRKECRDIERKLMKDLGVKPTCYNCACCNDPKEPMFAHCMIHREHISAMGSGACADWQADLNE